MANVLFPEWKDFFFVAGAPVVLSHPHFLYADEEYQKGVVGLNPDPEKHLIHVDLETVIIIKKNFFFIIRTLILDVNKIKYLYFVAAYWKSAESS